MYQDPAYSYIPCVLTGCLFYGFGLKWCHEYAKYWVSLRPREDLETKKGLRLAERFNRMLESHPVEGTLKLSATAIGLAATLASGPTVGYTVSPKVVLATIYLFFAFSGLVDVLNFYFPHTVSDGLVKLALAQSFFVEGLLLLWNEEKNATVYTILIFISWSTSVAVALELVWPGVKLLRASVTMLHGEWIAHMVGAQTAVSMMPDRVNLVLSWHIAAASAVTLCIVAITRSCAPRIILEEPPEIPIYDYCHDPTQKI